MGDSSGARGQRARELFEAACDLDRERRDRFLRKECSGDSELRNRVDVLLDAYEEEKTLINTLATDQSTDWLTPGARIGGYHLVERLGAGGMGEVWRAHDERLNRDVAIKFISNTLVREERFQRRFENECRALSALDCEGIARIHAADVHEGCPYFVMQLVQGENITRFCDKERLDCRQRLELFLRVCRAAQAAHVQGVIHRDLKPSNILVASVDGEPVPTIIDFGIAKSMGLPFTDTGHHTKVGEIIGTPSYSSPEQLSPDRNTVDMRTDVYALGAILHELVTGEVPKAEAEPIDPPSMRVKESTNPAIAHNRNTDSSSLGVTLKGDLDNIVLKALAKEVGRRYRSVAELIQDVQAYLEDRRPGARNALLRFARRNRRLAWPALLAVVLVVGGWFLRPSSSPETPATSARSNQELDLVIHFFSSLGERRRLDIETPPLPRGTQLKISLKRPPELGHLYILELNGVGQVGFHDEEQLVEAEWGWIVDGPPPSETLIALLVRDPLSVRDQTRITNQLDKLELEPALRDGTRIHWDEHGNYLVELDVDGRGPRRIVGNSDTWQSQVMTALRTLNPVSLSGVTFAVAEP